MSVDKLRRRRRRRRRRQHLARRQRRQSPQRCHGHRRRRGRRHSQRHRHPRLRRRRRRRLRHIDADNDDPTNFSSADGLGRIASVTAYSYDADNRPLDTVTGAQTTDATDTTTNGTPDADGLANTRTRTVYDPDCNTVATLPPQAFSGSGSPVQLTTNANTAVRTDFDLDGRPTTTYDPRYSSTITDTGAGNDGGSSKNQQTAECPTGAAPSFAPGVDTYSGSIGVCITRVQYVANGNTVRQWLPTSNGHDNRYATRSYSDDNLALTETGPNPTGSGRVTTHSYRYDGNQRPVRDTDANGTTTTYTADGLTAQTDGQCYHIGTEQQTARCTWNGGTTVTHRTTNRYDADGNLTSVAQPRALDPSQSTVSGLTAADFTSTTTWTSDGLKATVT